MPTLNLPEENYNDSGQKQSQQCRSPSGGWLENESIKLANILCVWYFYKDMFIKHESLSLIIHTVT